MESQVMEYLLKAGFPALCHLQRSFLCPVTELPQGNSGNLGSLCNLRRKALGGCLLQFSAINKVTNPGVIHKSCPMANGLCWESTHARPSSEQDFKMLSNGHAHLSD